LQDRKGFKADENYYYHLIAKAIMFKKAEKIISGLGYGGYNVI
jgi:hypothetical protein